MTSIYDIGLDRNAANHQPLTPLTILERAAMVFPETTAIINGASRISYRDFWRRSLRHRNQLPRLKTKVIPGASTTARSGRTSASKRAWRAAN